MTREEIIQAGNNRFNQALTEGAETPDLTGLAAEDADLVEQMQAAYQAARQPQSFTDRAIWRFDERFEMAYELLRITFDADVLDPRAMYVSWLKDRTEPLPDFVMIGRFWRASGRHRYAPDGQLLHFEFDPLVSTESAASIILANYFSHASAALEHRVGIGAISYLATRPVLRGRGGHGRHLLGLFEAELRRRAAERGEPLHAIVLESEDRAVGFWSKMGFRYPQGTRYIHPPLSFDKQTGEPVTNRTSETFMVKFMDGADSSQAGCAELLELVRLVYDHWYSPECSNEAATARARALVFDELFGIFRSSLPTDSQSVPLVPLQAL